MRDLHKGASLAAAILGCVSMALALMSVIVVFANGGNAGTGLSTLFGLAVTALMTVAMFRKKADLLTGIAFGVGALQALVFLITGMLTIGSGDGIYFSNIENVFLLLAMGAMAVDCFLRLPLSYKTRALVFCGALAVHFLLDTLMYTAFYANSFGRYGAAPVIGSVVGYIMGVLPATAMRLCAAYALAYAKEPQADYGYNGAYAQPNAYQSGAYSQPQYGQNAGGWYGYQTQPQQGYGYQPAGYPQAAYAAPAGRDPKDYGYIGMAAHVLLCLFTCGIWSLIWIYKTTETLNRTPDQQQSPICQLLLYLFVPFYAIYWFYKQGQRADLYARGVGRDSDSATVCLILGIFLPIGAVILLQDSINKTAEIIAHR